MKELLFDWITKGQYQLTFLDAIIFIIEATILILIIFGLASLIDYIRYKFNFKRSK